MINTSKQGKEHINMSDYQNNKQEIGAIFALFPHIPPQSSENLGTTTTFDVRNAPFPGNLLQFLPLASHISSFFQEFHLCLLTYSYSLVYDLVQSRSLSAVS